MGHGWRETNPKEAEAHDNYVFRLVSLRKELGKLSLAEISKWTLEELDGLLRIVGKYPICNPSKIDLDYFEKKLQEIQTTRKV